ncbi:MmcQ/YjbR family DNA-binding protein [Rhodococcus rhodnii]|nr:MmcQ/YjbR family DNA-binding protein [Rhodococcus rhodnii]TXG92770.1 MmcQ/YjbR family DNA-binding protein [Rhodococcus rhodnii]
MPHPTMFDDADPLLARVRRIALTLPEASEAIAHGRPTFRCGKMFGIYGGSVKGGSAKGSGRSGTSPVRHDHAVLFVPEQSERPALTADPRFFVPAYLGPYGWLGLDVTADCDWDEIAELLDASYRAVAPQRCIVLLDATR